MPQVKVSKQSREYILAKQLFIPSKVKETAATHQESTFQHKRYSHNLEELPLLEPSGRRLGPPSYNMLSPR